MITMELVQELLVTASFAFLLSFLMAKLISKAMGYDSEANDKVDLIHDDAKDVKPFKPNQSDHVKLPTLDMESNSSQYSSFDEDSGFVDASKGRNEVREGAEEKEEGLISIDDDWEGIERSELETDFEAAAAFVGEECSTNSKNLKLRRINSDVETQLYGLHKVAIQGRCHEPQPMPFTFSALAKWNAWHRFGNMSSEEAMERYVGLLSDVVPGWMEDLSLSLKRKVREDAAYAKISKESDHDSGSCLSYEPNFANQRELDMEKADATTGNATKVTSEVCSCITFLISVNTVAT